MKHRTEPENEFVRLLSDGIYKVGVLVKNHNNDALLGAAVYSLAHWAEEADLLLARENPGSQLARHRAIREGINRE